MSSGQFAKLEKLDLRKYWKDESKDFTPWLAEPENISLLGESLGLDMTIESTEESVGPFYADIVCKETSSGRLILIENQLGRTDHNHLGQILTYSAGLEPFVVVWIASEFRDEHRAAIDWLNSITDESTHFFALEIELWQIGNSAPAPKFNIAAKPNDWQKAVKPATRLTDLQKLQLGFWTGFAEFLRLKDYSKIPKPYPQGWMVFSTGIGGVFYSTAISTWHCVKETWEPEIRVELGIDSKYSKHFFQQLESQKEAIETQLGVSLIWHNPENARMCRIIAQLDADFTRKENWPDQMVWLHETLLKFKDVFGDRVKALTPPSEDNGSQ